MKKGLYEKSQNLTILFVEDYLPLQKIIASILKDYFNHVTVSSNGEDALKEYISFEEKNQKPYDIVMTDFEMPKLNGLELITEIRKRDEKQIFIVISAHQDSNNLIEFINLGIKYFASKPIGRQNMINVLDKVCSIFSSSSENILYINRSLIWHKKEKSLFYNDEHIDLAKYDSLLLEVLVDSFNLGCSIDNILNHFYINHADIKKSNIRNMVTRLRKKIPDIKIENTYGVGYKLSIEESRC